MSADLAAPVLDGDAATKETVTRLVRVLEREGFVDLCASFDPLSPRVERWAEVRGELDGRLGHIADLLLLSRRVETQDDPVLAELGDLLMALGPGLRDRDGRYHLGDCVLYLVDGHWLFFERPRPNQSLYYGDDSFALMWRLGGVARPSSALDLCCGSGIQSLRLARTGCRVTAVDINPMAARLCALNAVMNGYGDRMRVFQGDVADEPDGLACYDHITLNPPLLPAPDDIGYPFVGAGGADGLAVTWSVLDTLPRRLARHGRAQIIGAGLSDGVLPLFLDRLRRWSGDAGMRTHVLVVSHQPAWADGAGFAELLARTAAMGGAVSLATATARYRSLLQEGAANHFCTFLLRVQHGEGLLLTDISGAGRGGLWFA